MSSSDAGNKYLFLEHDGEMASRTRNFDWSGTSLGTPDKWPQSLRTVVGILLRSKFPMFLWWGKELIQFYNDAYRPSLGNDGKHPGALGQKGEDTWQEIWPVIKPLIDQVLAGGDSTWSEDQLIPIYRNGHLEDVYWTFSYSAVLDENDKPAGVLVTCTETTDKVKNLEQLRDSNTIFNSVANSSPTGLWLSDEQGEITYVNTTLVDWTGIPHNELLREGWANAIVEEDRKRSIESFLNAVATRTHYDVIFRIKKKDGSAIWCRAAGDPYYRDDGTYAGYAGFCMDVNDLITVSEKIEENQRQLLASFEEAPVAIAVISKDDLTFRMANSFYGQLVGRRPGEIIDKPLLVALPELIGQGFDLLLQQVIETGIAYNARDVEVSIARNGQLETIYVDLTYQPRRNGDNAITGVLVVATDITEQVAARREIAQSEARFRSLVEEAPIATCMFVGPELIIEVANEMMIRAWGKDQSVIGRPLIEAVPELIGQPFIEILNEVFKTGEPYSSSDAPAQLMVDGVLSTYYFNFTYKPLFNAAGEVYGVMDMAEDVTEQVLARRKLEQTEAELRGAVELAGLATWSYDIQSGVYRYSQRFMEWLGFTDDINDLEAAYSPLPGEYRTSVPEAIEEGIKKGVYENEHPIVNTVTGQTRIIHAQGHVFYDTLGRPLMLRGTAQDITEQRNIQLSLEQQVQERTEALAASYEELQSKNDELADTNQSLLHSNEELAQYAYVASHDLQEPLRKIQIFSGMLNQLNHAPESKPIIEKITQSAERMSLLIKDLLDFSRLLKSDSLMRPVKLEEVVSAIKGDFELTIAEKNAVITIGALPAIEAVSLQMNQLFYNLISNALKFTTPGVRPHIQIDAKLISIDEVLKHIPRPVSRGDYYHFTVSDNGIGFDVKYAEQIFEVFKRLHGRDIYPGSGIGLALCRRIVTNHNGHMYAVSEIGKGTTFHILLPVSQNDVVSSFSEPYNIFPQTN